MTNNLTESSLNKLNSTLRLPVPMPMPVPTSLDVIVFPSGSRRIPLFPVNGLFQRGACHRMGEGGQFGHSRAGVRYFHRERELELPTWRPSSRYTSHQLQTQPSICSRFYFLIPSATTPPLRQQAKSCLWIQERILLFSFAWKPHISNAQRTNRLAWVIINLYVYVYVCSCVF